MKLAHLSDPHLCNLQGVSWTSLLRGKRITGFANLMAKRRWTHHEQIACALARRLRDSDVDHVVITGDLTNLALEPEFEKVQNWLREDLALSPDRVTIVPGNHDRYTAEATRSRSLERTLTPYLGDSEQGTFPFVRTRGPLALIGLDSAVVQPAFVAAGQLGSVQLNALRRILDAPELRSRTPVLLLHHPPRWTRSWLREMQDGLRDAAALQALLPHRPGLILHGHRHRTLLYGVYAGTMKWVVGGAPSASNTDPSPDRIAAFNTYEFDETGMLLHVTSTTVNAHGEAKTRPLEIT